MSAIDVLSPGVLTTVQDLGRPGLAHLGVSPSGAVDAPSLERGNRLVGNGRTAAALEATLIGPRLRFRCAALVAVTGPRRDERAFEVGAGDELDVGRLEHGARAYVCVRGGIDAAPVLGRRTRPGAGAAHGAGTARTAACRRRAGPARPPRSARRLVRA
jgi:allophanate hydrolase subunit 2